MHDKEGQDFEETAKVSDFDRILQHTIVLDL